MKKERNQNLKKQLAVELIREALLDPEQIDPILSFMVQDAGSLTKNNKLIWVAQLLVKEELMSDDFIKKFTEPLEEAFTQKELTKLISFYKTEEMRSFVKKRIRIFHMLYGAFHELVHRTIKQIAQADERTGSLTSTVRPEKQVEA